MNEIRRKIKKNAIPFPAIASVFLMLYVSSDTLLFGTNKNETVKLIGYIITFLLTLFWLFRVYCFKREISKKMVFSLFVFVASSMLTMLTTLDVGSNIIKYAYECCLIFLAFCFCISVDFTLFKKTFIKIVCFLSIFSIISFLTYEILFDIIAQFPTISNSGNIGYYFLLFGVEQEPMMYVPHRSFGIFREPGVYVIFLCLSIMLELFGEEKINISRIISEIVAVIITLSTGGYIILACIFFTFLLNRQSNNNRRLKTGILVFGILGFTFMLMYTNLLNIVFSKLFTINASKNSRFDSIYINIKMLMDEPLYILTGRGYTYVESSFRFWSNQIGSAATDNTNTLFRIFSTHGLIYTGVFIRMLFGFCKKTSHTTIQSYMVFALFFLMFFNESIMLNPVLYILLFYGVMEAQN